MILRGMDIDYISKDVANRFFGDIINPTKEELVKQIMESTIPLSPEDKYRYIVEFLSIKDKLESLGV